VREIKYREYGRAEEGMVVGGSRCILGIGMRFMGMHGHGMTVMMTWEILIWRGE
jgi:hypothetical protein